MSIKLILDTTGLEKHLEELQKEVKKEVSEGVKKVAEEAYSFVQKTAKEELSDRAYGKFMNNKKGGKNLNFKELSPGMYVISIEQDALWIEDGLPPNFDMKPGLLKGKDHAVVPFEHGKAPSKNTGFEQILQSKVKAELKKRDIPYKKIEVNTDGSPKIGKLHTFDLGPSIKRPWWSADPLSKVNIYQTKTKSGKVQRSIVTFRTVKADQAGKWIHPGYKASKFLDRAAEFADKLWEDTILPQLLEKWK